MASSASSVEPGPSCSKSSRGRGRENRGDEGTDSSLRLPPAANAGRGAVDSSHPRDSTGGLLLSVKSLETEQRWGWLAQDSGMTEKTVTCCWIMITFLTYKLRLWGRFSRG